jgi:hypothetical protein
MIQVSNFDWLSWLVVFFFYPFDGFLFFSQFHTSMLNLFGIELQFYFLFFIFSLLTYSDVKILVAYLACSLGKAHVVFYYYYFVLSHLIGWNLSLVTFFYLSFSNLSLGFFFNIYQITIAICFFYYLIKLYLFFFYSMESMSWIVPFLASLKLRGPQI